MRVVVCADLEGIGGVDAVGDCFPSWPRGYRRARELMEAEVAAVVDGVREAGVDDVVVTDWHFVGNNLRRDRIDAPVLGLWQDGLPRMGREVYGDVDLAVFVGMHAAAGAPNAFMSHTFWQGLAVEVDGVAVNEAYLWATMVAAAGARVGFVAGESRLEEECAALLPDVPVVAVKRSISRTQARTLQRPETIRERLRSAAARAVREARQRPRFEMATGTPVRITFYEERWADAAAGLGLGEPDGERTIATRLEQPDALVPLVASCALLTEPGREGRLLARLAPPPERSELPEALRRAVVACVHGAGLPIMRRAVRKWMEEDPWRYPAPPGTQR